MLSLNFDPFPILESSRLCLRAIHDGDVNEVFLLRSDKELMKFIPRPIASNLNDAADHIKMVTSIIAKNEGLNWAITEIGNDKMIGIIGFYRIKPENFRGELGYMILKQYQNKGYISEAVVKTLDYAFNTLGFNSIEAVIDPENEASERVLIKNGFRKEAHLRENEYWNGKFLDTVIYSVLKNNFIQKYTPPLILNHSTDK